MKVAPIDGPKDNPDDQYSRRCELLKNEINTYTSKLGPQERIYYLQLIFYILINRCTFTCIKRK